ncbi:serum response factor homolog [Anopheles darlingi]|uniref:serum response factor homolog n=1 Tax=Anopheles darlingi TaxID=43151 RepID=UPI0021002BB1|nr:serum response factor homolog [Anopheles darlingi]
MDPTGRDSRYNLQYMMPDTPEIYGNPNGTLARPPSGGLGGGQVMTRGGNGNGLLNGPQCGSGGGGGGGLSRGIKRTNSDCYDDRQQLVGSQTMTGLEGITVGSEVVDESYTSLQPKKSPPSNGKKTKGRVKIKMEYIDNKLRRYTTFSKRKTGIMKKAYELSTLTGTQVMLLVASETGHVYTFATRKLQPMITSEAGKALIQTCLNSPDPPTGSSGDQRMSATGFEETELSYNIGDEDSKDDRSPMSSGSESDDGSGPESPPPGPSSSINSNHHQHPSSVSEKTSSSSAIAAAAPTGNAKKQQQQQSIDTKPETLVSTSTSTPVALSPTAAATMNAIQQQIVQQQQALQQQIQQQLQTQKQQKQPTTRGKASLKNKPEPQPIAPAVTSVATAPAVTSSIVYPAAALSTLPQDVLVNLIQSGQIQLHGEENGSQQYVTIPMPLIKASSSKSSSNGQQKSPSAGSPSSSTTRNGGGSSTSSRRRSSAAATIKTEVLD